MYLSIDIGGTSIKYGVIAEDELIYSSSIDTLANESNFSVLNRLDIILDAVLKEYSIQAVCISSAGMIDSKNGVVIYANENLPNYTGTNIHDHIQTKYNLQSTIINDVNAAALGEAKHRHVENMFMITVGTGIGGALIIDNKLYEGQNYKAGEVGYLMLENGLTFEDLSSTTFLVKQMKELTSQTLTGFEISKLARDNDANSLKAIDIMTKNLAKGILIITQILDPQLIVLGGGVMESSDLFLPKIKQHIKELDTTQSYNPVIEPAQLGNTAGMLGAYWFYKDNTN